MGVVGFAMHRHTLPCFAIPPTPRCSSELTSDPLHACGFASYPFFQAGSSWSPDLPARPPDSPHRVAPSTWACQKLESFMLASNCLLSAWDWLPVLYI